MPILARGNIQAIILRPIEGRLGLTQFGDAVNHFAEVEADNLDGIVSRCRDEDSLARDIGAHVTDAAFDASQRDGLFESQRLSRATGRKQESEKNTPQTN